MMKPVCWFVSWVIALMMVGCVDAPSGSVSSAQTERFPSPSPRSVTSVPTVGSSVAPFTQPSPTKSATSVPAFTLQITSPEDEAVVNAAKIFIAGKTAPGAVVSVDGYLVEVEPDGTFRVPILLEEGPNIIEIVASNPAGNELNTVLRVLYEP